MARIFEGNVSVVLNTRGEIALKRDPQGRFSADNADELYQTMLKLAKERKVSINKYSLYSRKRTVKFLFYLPTDMVLPFWRYCQKNQNLEQAEKGA